MRFSLWVLLVGLLYGEGNLSAIYYEKYLPNLDKKKQSVSTIVEDTKSFKFDKKDDIDDFLYRDRNSSRARKGIKEAKKYIVDINASSRIYKDAQEINKAYHSEKVKDKTREMIQHVLYDKNITVDGLEINLSKEAAKIFAKPSDLKMNRKIFLCISSSMPLALIHNYMRQIEGKYKNIELVMNGFVGGMSKLKPTMDFIKKTIDKGDGTQYTTRVQINPKIFMRYQVNRVPALIVDPSYDRMLEDNSLYTGKTDDYFVVVYGAFALEAMIDRAEEELKKMEGE